MLSDSLINNIELPRDALMCLNMNCTNPQHAADICNMYDKITTALNASSEPLFRHKKVYNSKPGWNEYVSVHHEAAREAFKRWSVAGRPRQGEVFELKKQTNIRFKYAVRYIKNNENTFRADGLARKLQTNNHIDFWKAVRVMNSNKTALPSDIEGVSGPDNIAQIWREHYMKLFNCVKSNVMMVDNIDLATNVVVRSSEVADAIDLLVNNKACGLDKITAEHLKYASNRLKPMLAMCFTGFMVHGVLPNSILSVLLVPVLKDKAGKLNSRDNYRPIALASIISKVLERILLTRMEMYVLTTDNQFGFKRKHSTDLCIYGLKELISKYESQNSSVFLCFIDLSKAFDRINHEKLFMKLLQRNVPKYLIRILIYWYAQQTFQVKWDNAVSTPFHVGNGVRQGGILSPFLFNVYMDDLSRKLNACKTGCTVGDNVINHLMYADDLVILSPYTAALQQLLRICTQYGTEHDIIYNAKKSSIMVVRSREDRKSIFPAFYLSDVALSVSRELKYLRHIISDDLSDDSDILRQCRKILCSGQYALRKFSMCSVNVKCALFRSYHPSVHGPLMVLLQSEKHAKA